MEGWEDEYVKGVAGGAKKGCGGSVEVATYEVACWNL
jgi:hypothetical protein